MMRFAGLRAHTASRGCTNLNAASALQKQCRGKSSAAGEQDPRKSPVLMTHSEAFVETLNSHGVKDVFGIVGSAFMDALDLFPRAGIRFISVQHEQNAAHMADGYYRASGQTGSCTAQNGPGIS